MDKNPLCRIFIAQQMQWLFILLNGRKAPDWLEEVIVRVIIIDLGNFTNNQIPRARCRPENMGDEWRKRNAVARMDMNFLARAKCMLDAVHIDIYIGIKLIAVLVGIP